MSLVRKWVVDSLFANKAVVLFSHSACCTNCRKVKSIVDEVTLSRFGITPVVIEVTYQASHSWRYKRRLTSCF